MKKTLAILLTIPLLSGCNETKQTNTTTGSDSEMEITASETKKKQDTIYNYWELILDTISDRKQFKLLDKNYTLEVKTFSLNDSLIIRNLEQRDQQIYIDHSHTIVTDFTLLTDYPVDQRRIDRTAFKKALMPEFYTECNLYSTTIDNIAGDTVYLTSDLAVPDTDNQWSVWYSIVINNNRLGDIEIKETDYVGL